MFEDNSEVRTPAALCELNAIKSPVHKYETQISNINLQTEPSGRKLILCSETPSIHFTTLAVTSKAT